VGVLARGNQAGRRCGGAGDSVDGEREADGFRRVPSGDVTHIAIGSDHAGYLLKQHLVELLRGQGHTVDDLGTDSTESVDYVPYCAAVGRAVRDGKAALGIVLGGSGQGEQLAANKVRGVRAALCNDLYTARMARSHNDANVLSMGARVVGEGLAEEILALFLSTPFEGGRHARRVAQITELEAEF
jgi:ribose 5-phosphate isomerase B